MLIFLRRGSKAMVFKVSRSFDKLVAVCSPYRRDLMYGRSSVLRNVANYPLPLPIRVICEHGVDAVQVDLFEEKQNPYGYLVFSKEKQKTLIGLGKKNVIQIPDPFTFIANKDYSTWVRQVSVSDNSNNKYKKLLFFYAHSTGSVIDNRSVSQYINEIKNLKLSYDVTVCLHFSDLRRGVHKILCDQGIKYVSISEHPRSQFCYSFFNLINQYDIACSTIPGSYLYYCTYANMPFFLIRLPPLLQNVGDTAQKDDFKGFFDDYPNKNAYDLFDLEVNPNLEITFEQRNFVNELLGYTDENQSAVEVRKKIRSVLSHALWS